MEIRVPIGSKGSSGMSNNSENEKLFLYDKGRLFSTLVDILIHFDEFCERNNLQYYAFAGTLLGTIRHKGIIPWDDDIDVVMPREDYDKMLSLVSNSGLDLRYQFLNADIDPYFPKSFTRLTNTDTTEIPIKDAMYKYNHGCFIDIFPVDYIPEGKVKRSVYYRITDLYIQLLHVAGRYQSNAGSVGMSRLRRVIYSLSAPLFNSGFLSVKKISAKLNKHASKYIKKKDDCKEIGTIVFSAGNPRFIYKKDDYLGGAVRWPFESTSIYIPKGYDNILRKTYGDYMTPVKQQSEHGNTIVDLDTGYEEYIKAHYKELQELFISARMNQVK